MNIYNEHQMIVLLKSSPSTSPFSTAAATARAPAAKEAAPAATSAAVASVRSTSVWNISWPRELQRRPTTERLTEWDINIKTGQSLKHLQNNHYSLLIKKMNDEDINKKKNFFYNLWFDCFHIFIFIHLHYFWWIIKIFLIFNIFLFKQFFF